MLKAAKECMKNWLVTHERLYWYIVVGIAVFFFGLITMFGFAKLEQAEAATELSLNAKKINYDTLPTYQELVDIIATYYDISDGVTADNTMLWSYDDGLAYYIFYGESLNNLKAEAFTSSTVGAGINAKLSVARIGYNANTGKHDYSTFSGGFDSYYSSSNEYKGYVWGAPITCVSGGATIPTITKVTEYPKASEFSSSAPYATFKKLVVDNKMVQGCPALAKVENLYSEYFSPSTWTYHGKINNIGADDVSYCLNLQFIVELPTIDYVRNLYELNGYSTSKGRDVLLHNKQLVEYWNADPGAETRCIKVEYSLEPVLNQFGEFTYSFNFVQWEYLLRAFDSALASELDGYDAHWRSILLSFIHVKQIRSELITTKSDCSVYGGYVTDLFKRGVYDSCAESYTKVDKNFVSSDLLEDMISDDLRVAEQEYIKDLENRVEELENQMNGFNGVGDAFGSDLETSDIWSGFTNVVKGLGGIAPAIYSLSSLAGVVLAFLPLEMAGIMASTLLAICIIAIVKAIRG